MFVNIATTAASVCLVALFAHWLHISVILNRRLVTPNL
ncbi:type I toxin-antitoxin system Fst family toxin [Staphylococcus saprophyticus]